MKQIKKIITLSVLSSSVLLGAAPNIGDIEKQIQLPKEVTQQKDVPLVKIGGVKQYAPVMKDDKSGKTLFVKSFKIDGAIHIDKDNLQKLISTYTNKALTFNDLQAVTLVITKEYRDQGYFVARAYLPVQDINKNNGVIIISIIEGDYGEFKIENNSRVKDSLVQGMIDDAKARDNVVSTGTLERAMILINNTPGIIVTSANIKPGKEVGSSDFSVVTEPSKTYGGYVLVDNTGSRYTGKNRLMAGLNTNSPFNIGDKISLNGLISNGENLMNGRVAYSAPLMSNGLRGEVSYSITTYSLIEEYQSLDAVGKSSTLDATLIYPAIATRRENLNASINIASKDLTDEVRSTNDITNKNVKVLNIGLEYNKNYLAFGLDSQSIINFGFTYGNLRFDDPVKEAADIAGANTNGNYSKVTLDLVHEASITSKISLATSLKMQYALGNNNLDGSEDFSLGGAYGVKVYPDGELSGENGYLFNIETKYRLANINALSSQIGFFYDLGRAYMADNTVGFESKILQDVGIGYYASYKDFFGKLQAAWTANSDVVSSEPASNSRVLFQGGWSF